MSVPDEQCAITVVGKNRFTARTEDPAKKFLPSSGTTQKQNALPSVQ